VNSERQEDAKYMKKPLAHILEREGKALAALLLEGAT
jgi:hypothetical protein